jgi:hypothetical protein
MLDCRQKALNLIRGLGTATQALSVVRGRSAHQPPNEMKVTKSGTARQTRPLEMWYREFSPGFKGNKMGPDTYNPRFRGRATAELA